MLVGRFRASYAHVFEPSTPPGGGEAKYQITMLIPKSDVNTYNAVVAEKRDGGQADAQQHRLGQGERVVLGGRRSSKKKNGGT